MHLNKYAEGETGLSLKRDSFLPDPPIYFVLFHALPSGLIRIARLTRILADSHNAESGRCSLAPQSRFVTMCLIRVFRFSCTLIPCGHFVPGQPGV